MMSELSFTEIHSVDFLQRHVMKIEAENKRLREALEEARTFVDSHSEEWYTYGQKLLTKIDKTLKGDG